MKSRMNIPHVMFLCILLSISWLSEDEESETASSSTHGDELERIMQQPWWLEPEFKFAEPEY